jgi:putative transposase
VVGLDIGPSNIAAVGETDAIFEQFLPVRRPAVERIAAQRAMDRSKRANNPQCFDDGRWKKGARMRVRSKRYQALTLKRRERERRLAAERKRSHGELANRILGQGTTVKTEKLSYQARQRQRYGKRLKVRAPGLFVRMLERKAATGGELIALAMRNTCLSRFCHIDGTYEKKPLKQRYHQFPDATRVGRDLYSAFLARYEDGCLDAIQTATVWTGTQALSGIGRI